MLAIFDNNHCAVVQIADALVVFLAAGDNLDTHALARQHHRFDGAGELVDVERPC